MVKIALQIKATLEFIEELYTSHPNFNFYLKIKCLNCGELSEKWHDITESDVAYSQTRYQENHFVAKCKLCGRENALNIVKDSNQKYTNGDNFQTIVIFDCRGIEPVEFAPNAGWIAKVEGSGSIYRDVDLSENEWVEYDTKIKESVGVYEFQYKFIKVK